MPRFLAAVIAALLLTAQAPIPRQSEQPPATTGQQNPAYTERGTQQSPVFVKVISPEHPEADAAQNEGKRLTDLTGDLANYTLGLFIATCVLAVLTGGLLILGFLQVSDAKASIAAAVKAADAAAAQVKLGREEFIATFRPQLKVRHVSLGTPQVPFTSTPGIGDQIIGSLIVVNRGNTTATVVDSRYLIFFSVTHEGLPMLSPMEESWGELIPAGTILGAGESYTFPINGIVVLDRQVPGSTFIPISADRWAVYVMGQIQYRDEAGNERFMGFCRKWLGEGTFAPVPDPDYEYED